MSHQADLRHGGALDVMAARFPEAPKPWVDLSTGINPWPYPATIAGATLKRLPTAADMAACQRAMAAAFGAPQDALLLTPGTSMAIALLPTVLAAKSVAILSPTYGDHARSWRAAGAAIIETPDPLADISAADVIVMCRPNNPDGRSLDQDALLSCADQLAERGGWLIVDEAYGDLDPKICLAPFAGRPGLVVLRSFGKFYGLAGVRLGAVLAPQPVLAKMSRLLGDWPVSMPALTAGAAAYVDLAWQDQMRAKLPVAAASLNTLLIQSGFDVIGGTDLFRTVQTQNAEKLWHILAERGVYVRRFAWSDTYVRIGLPKDQAGADRLRAALNV